MQTISSAQIGEGYEKSSFSLTDIKPEQDGLYTCRAFQKIRQTDDVELSFLIKVFRK